VNEQQLRERLRDQPIPGEREAEERSWELLRTGFEERSPEAVRRRIRPRRLAVALAVGAVLAIVLALTPAGAEVRDWIEDVIEEPGEEDAKPALTSLPASGQLVVESAQGPWVVQEDGSRRLLGDYEQATWSPSGLYLAVTDDRQLTAVDPLGDHRWSVSPGRPISDPAWAPSGIRVGYLSGNTLRVVAGDGTDDRLLYRPVAAVAPSWKPDQLQVPPQPGIPEAEHVLAFVGAHGAVRAVRADLGRQVWRFDPKAYPIEVEWSADAERLYVLTRSSLQVLDERGAPFDGTFAMPRTSSATDAAFAPRGHDIALIRRNHVGTDEERSELVVLSPGGRERQLFVGPGVLTDVAWSPNGEWLLVAWRDADQWLFINADHPNRIEAIDNISRQFDPGARGRSAFPEIAGWCCPP
jgi:dipeptidyl aminopeptidase/acylaminoacyl peptidase